jgi:uncharacterized protein
MVGLGAGALGGYAASLAHLPIPWMLGPLFAVAAMRIAGANVAVPPGTRQGGQWIIGTALGLYFTPHVVAEVARLWPWLLVVAVGSIVIGYVAGLVLARIARIDLTTAIFASVPGGAAEMATLGERFHARTDRIAAAQSLRVVIVVTLIPSVFAALDLHGADYYAPGIATVDYARLAVLLAATLAAGALAARIGVPNAFVLGALAIAIPLTALEVNLSAVPTPLANAGQWLIGCALGGRFDPGFLRGAHRFVGGVGTSVMVSIALSTAMGLALAQATDLYPATVVLGTAPGGVAEMCITAKVLLLGVPIVTAFHVTRLVVLLLATGPLFGFLRSRVAAARRGDRT